MEEKWPTTDPRRHGPGFRYIARCHARYLGDYTTDYPLREGWGASLASASYLSAWTPRTLREFGFLIELPEKDIVFAHERDFDTGRSHYKKTTPLSDIIGGPGGPRRRGYKNRKNAKELLMHSYSHEHTELLVRTDNIKIVGIFYNYYMVSDYSRLARRDRHDTIAAIRNMSTKHNLPLVFLDPSDGEYILAEKGRMTFWENKQRESIIFWRFIKEYFRNLWHKFWLEDYGDTRENVPNPIGKAEFSPVNFPVNNGDDEGDKDNLASSPLDSVRKAPGASSTVEDQAKRNDEERAFLFEELYKLFDGDAGILKNALQRPAVNFAVIGNNQGDLFSGMEKFDVAATLANFDVTGAQEGVDDFIAGLKK